MENLPDNTSTATPPTLPTGGPDADSFIQAAYAAEEANNPQASQVADYLASFQQEEAPATAPPTEAPTAPTSLPGIDATTPPAAAPAPAAPVAPPAAPASNVPAPDVAPEVAQLAADTAPLLALIKAGQAPTEAQIAEVATKVNMPADVVKEFISLKSFYEASQGNAPETPAPAAPSGTDDVVAKAQFNQTLGGADKWDAFAQYMSGAADASTLQAYQQASPSDRVKIASVFVEGFKAQTAPQRRDVTSAAPTRSTATPQARIDPNAVRGMFSDPRYSYDATFRSQAQRLLVQLQSQQ